MDFLGLRTLTVIRDTETAVQQKEPAFTHESIDYDDPATYAMLPAARPRASSSLNPPA